MNCSQIPVVYRPQAFSKEIIRATAPEGSSILEIVESLNLPPHFKRYGMVCVNAEPVPFEMWRYVRPKVREREVIVTLHIRLQGDDVLQIIKVVAVIAVVAAATLVSGGALAGVLGASFAAGGIGAILGAAGITIAGTLAINALIPPPTTKPTSVGKAVRAGGIVASPTAVGAEQGGEAASLSGNVIAPGASIPRVIGTMRCFPPFIVEPLVEVIGDDQYAEGVIALAGPHDIEDVKVGDVYADDIPELDYEIATSPTLVTRQSKTIQIGLAVSQHVIEGPDNPDLLDDQATPSNSLPRWHRMLTRDSPDEVWIPLALSEGVYDNSDPTNYYAFPLRIRLRLLGETTWINCPEVHYTSRIIKPLIPTIRFIFTDTSVNEPALTQPGGVAAFYHAFKVVPAQNIAPVMGGWTADSYFSAGAGNDLLSAATYLTTKVRHTHILTDRVNFYLDTASFSPGIYEIEIIQGELFKSDDFTAASYTYTGGFIYDFFGYFTSGGNSAVDSLFDRHYKIQIPSISSVWNQDPIVGTDMTCISLRVRSRQLSDISVLASGLVPDWDGASWTGSVATANPAPNFRYVLTGALNFDPLPEELIDDDELVAWRTHCSSNDYSCNAVVDGQASFRVAAMIASCGFARPRQCETWGVMIDKDRTEESVVQVLSFRNMAQFRWEKAFPRRPGGFRVNFINRHLGYKDDETIVLDPDSDVGSARLEQIRYEGLVDQDDVEARALFDLAQARARSTFYFGTTNIQHLVARRGDLVGVQHDIIDHVAGSAYIKEVLYAGGSPSYITGFILDGTIPRAVSDDELAVIGGGGGFGAIGEFAFGETSVEAADLQPAGQLITRVGLAIRIPDNSANRIVTTTGFITGDENDEITLVEPFVDDDIQPGQLLTSGIIATEYKRLILMGVSPKADLTADLVFVDEASELWTIF